MWLGLLISSEMASGLWLPQRPTRRNGPRSGICIFSHRQCWLFRLMLRMKMCLPVRRIAVPPIDLLLQDPEAI